MGNIRTNDLLYFVFGIEENERNDNDKGIDACMDRAYLDLCRTLRFKYSSEELSKIAVDDPDREDKIRVREGKEEFKTDVKYIICRSLKPLEANRFGSDESFDEWHVKTMTNIIKCWDSDLFKNDFTVGHAQKWLNMTLKYMWIMGILPKGWEDHLHVPLDDYILSAAKNEFQIERPKGPSSKWSKIEEYKDYYDYQDRIRKSLSEKQPGEAPIQWESKAWIGEAKNRNQNI